MKAKIAVRQCPGRDGAAIYKRSDLKIVLHLIRGYSILILPIIERLILVLFYPHRLRGLGKVFSNGAFI